MITDDERRETVENLRHLSYMNRVRYKEEFYELLDETVMEPDTGYHEMNDVFERIADLIDRGECERLQGFPSDWTKIPYRGKPADECPDGPRYKAIGNSMAVPVMRWIGERIALAEAGDIS